MVNFIYKSIIKRKPISHILGCQKLYYFIKFQMKCMIAIAPSNNYYVHKILTNNLLRCQKFFYTMFMINNYCNKKKLEMLQTKSGRSGVIKNNYIIIITKPKSLDSY